MVAATLVYEKLAWGADVKLYDGLAKAGKLHKVTLMAGVKSIKSYAPHRQSALVPKLFRAPKRAESFAGVDAVQKAVSLRITMQDQRQSALLTNLGDFGRVSHRLATLHRTYKAAHRHMMNKVVKYHMVPRQEKSFAPGFTQVQSFAAERKSVAAIMQSPQHRGVVPPDAAEQMPVDMWVHSRSVHQEMLNKHHMSTKGDMVKARARGIGHDGMTEQEQAVARRQDFEDMLDSYFLRQSRLPPAVGTGVNPMLSPLWSGLKIPM